VHCRQRATVVVQCKSLLTRARDPFAGRSSRGSNAADQGHVSGAVFDGYALGKHVTEEQGAEPPAASPTAVVALPPSAAGHVATALGGVVAASARPADTAATAGGYMPATGDESQLNHDNDDDIDIDSGGGGDGGDRDRGGVGGGGGGGDRDGGRENGGGGGGDSGGGDDDNASDDGNINGHAHQGDTDHSAGGAADANNGKEKSGGAAAHANNGKEDSDWSEDEDDHKIKKIKSIKISSSSMASQQQNGTNSNSTNDDDTLRQLSAGLSALSSPVGSPWGSHNASPLSSPPPETVGGVAGAAQHASGGGGVDPWATPSAGGAFEGSAGGNVGLDVWESHDTSSGAGGASGAATAFSAVDDVADMWGSSSTSKPQSSGGGDDFWGSSAVGASSAAVTNGSHPPSDAWVTAASDMPTSAASSDAVHDDPFASFGGGSGGAFPSSFGGGSGGAFPSSDASPWHDDPFGSGEQQHSASMNGQGEHGWCRAYTGFSAVVLHLWAPHRTVYDALLRVFVFSLFFTFFIYLLLNCFFTHASRPTPRARMCRWPRRPHSV
jgi:hypothetical protein